MDFYFQVWTSYFLTFIMLVVDIFAIIALYNSFFKGKAIIDYRNAYPTKRAFVKKHTKTFDVVARILFIVFVFGGSFIVYNHILDLPNVISKKTKIIVGIATANDSYGNDTRKRVVILRNINTNEQQYIKLVSEPIHSGECMKVEYFEHIQIGRVLSKGECDGNK